MAGSSPRNGLRKTLQNVLVVLHTSCLVAACATLLLKLDVLWLRHEWIYVLETKLRAIHTWLVWNGNTTRVPPSRHRNVDMYSVHVVCIQSTACCHRRRAKRKLGSKYMYHGSSLNKRSCFSGCMCTHITKLVEISGLFVRVWLRCP